MVILLNLWSGFSNLLHKLFSKNEFQSTLPFNDTQGVSCELCTYVRMCMHEVSNQYQNTSAIKAACRMLFHDDT